MSATTARMPSISRSGRCRAPTRSPLPTRSGPSLREIADDLPPGTEIGLAYDGTVYMENAIKEIFTTLAETVMIVGLIVFLFLGSVRTALVPLVAIPISLVGATTAMLALGFSLNLLTLLAIVLAVGLVVDDAIVVVENVARYMREGMGRVEAALTSARQLFAPIVAMTITLAAVYAPIGFLSGLTGVLFKEFVFTLAIAVIMSGIVAVTLSPIMSAYMAPESGREGRFTRLVGQRLRPAPRRLRRAPRASCSGSGPRCSRSAPSSACWRSRSTCSRARNSRRSRIKASCSCW